MNLLELATKYLGTLRYESTQRGRDLTVGHRVSAFGEREGILVWVPDLEPGRSFSTQEGPYLSRFETAAKEYPRAQKFMLVQTYEGLSKEFRSRAKAEYDVNVRVPAFFFDTPFKYEESPGEVASSAARELSLRGEERALKRAPQPFEVVQGIETKDRQDILDIFTRKTPSQWSHCLNLIVGPAGVGKTVLFEVLFSRLYSNFQKHKKEMRVFPRPLPLIPEYLRASVAPTLRSLAEGFLRTEFAAPIEIDTFQWMLVNGFGIWLLDGLDELIERDIDFFNALLDILTKPGSVAPRIVLCLRDSLLSTNQGLRDFLDEYSKDVAIYELSRWDTPSKRAFAKIEFGKQQEESFMNVLQTHKELNSLSSIPYYCKLIADEYKANRLQASYSEPELLGQAISNIIEREYGKGLLDRVLLPPPVLVELLQDLSAENAALGFRGLTPQTIREYTEIVLPSELDRQTFDRLITHTVQLALFCHGSATGSVQFTQEILEYYLLGERLYRSLCTNEGLFLRELSLRSIPADWVTLKTVAIKAQNDGKIDRLLYLVKESHTSDTAFRNLLQICAYAVKDPVSLKVVPFEARNISGIKLDGFDFRGTSFRKCDLTDAEFDQCLLQNAKFEGAIISRTGFFMKDKGDLEGATFGDMERVYSIRTQPRKPEIEYQDAKKWLRERTGVVEPITEPCAAALQLRYLFGKYVYPNGTAKRVFLDRRAVLTGKEFYNREKTLEAAIAHGYLIPEERYRDRIARSSGDAYSEIVNYVKDLTLSLGLQRLLNDICQIENCQHIPKGQNL